jgi:hypothetical protein
MKATLFISIIAASITLATANPGDPINNPECPSDGTCEDIIGLEGACGVVCDTSTNKCVCNSTYSMEEPSDPDYKGVCAL